MHRATTIIMFSFLTATLSSCNTLPNVQTRYTLKPGDLTGYNNWETLLNHEPGEISFDSHLDSRSHIDIALTDMTEDTHKSQVSIHIADSEFDTGYRASIDFYSNKKTYNIYYFKPVISQDNNIHLTIHWDESNTLHITLNHETLSIKNYKAQERLSIFTNKESLSIKHYSYKKS